MKGKQWLKKIVCTFAATCGTFLCVNLSTNAMNFEETVDKMRGVAEKLGTAYRDTRDIRIAWLGRKIFDTCEFLRTVAKYRPVDGFMSLGSTNFFEAYKIIKVSEQIMKWAGLMDERDPGVKLLLRGTHFPSVDKAILYQSALMTDGIKTAKTPRADGRRVHGAGVYMSSSPTEAGLYAYSGDSDAASQVSAFMNFGVEHAGRASSVYVISDVEQLKNILSCTVMMSIPNIGELSPTERNKYVVEFKKGFRGDLTVDEFVNAAQGSCPLSYTSPVSEVLRSYFRKDTEVTTGSRVTGAYIGRSTLDLDGDFSVRRPRPSDTVASRHRRESWFPSDPKQK